MSDSEESTKSSTSVENGLCNGDALSLVAEFDDLIRLMKQRRVDEVESAFIDFIEQTNEMRNQYDRSIKECRRLQGLLEQKTQELSEMENKLLIARRLLDKEKKENKKIIYERDRMVTV